MGITKDTTYAEISESQFRNYIARLADNLEHLAEDIRRISQSPLRPDVNDSPASRLAYDVQHTLSWGVANMNVPEVIIYAARLDLALADEKKKD